MADCPVTEDEILACEKRSQLLKLASRFKTKIDFQNVTSMNDIRTRLLLAVKRENGLMKDILSLTTLFEKVQEEDEKRRKTLRSYIRKANTSFCEMNESVYVLSLNEDPITDTSTHVKLLKDNKCPIVVAGEVSSGKSTLLNLFLGKIPGQQQLELPTSTLSCTGRVCELTYGDESHAKLRRVNGEVEEIPIEKLQDTINMQDKTPDSFNKFDVVQIFLPIPFLKSGITLVDTPGIGVDEEDSSIVREYVKKNNVFGFIFTIHASAGGGVNQKFQSLLQTLAGDEYLDKNGDRKLDPRSVVFCCNFWDEVPDSDKDETRRLIQRTVASKPFLRGFDSSRQLFFMDSKQAYYTWQAGFISNEFDGFIDGMKEFFRKGKLRKLRYSYNYVERVLERSLHSLRSYLYWAKQQRRIGETKQQQMLVYLRSITAKLKGQHSMLETMIDDQVNILTEKMVDFLKDKETLNLICTWTKTDIQTPSLDLFSYDKFLFEYKLDTLIDARISQVLLEWELNNLCVHSAQCLLGDAVYRTFTALGSSMDRFERGICSSNLFLEEDPGSIEDDVAMDDLARALHIATKKDFDIVFSKSYASSVSDISSGPHMLLDFLKAKKQGQKAESKKGPEGRSDRELVKYMKERSQTVVDGLRTSASARELIDNQMNDMRTFLTKKYENLLNRIKQNEKLVMNLQNLIENTIGTTEWYQKHTTAFRTILDNVLKFGVKNVFHKRAEVQIVHSGEDECFMPAGMFGSLFQAQLKSSGDMVTVKRTEGMFGDKLTETHKHFIIKHLSQLQKSPYIPKYIGMDVRGDLVLHGKFVTVRNHFLQSTPLVSRAAYIQDIAGFFLELGDALQFLRYQNLVHVEVSPDSVMIKVTDSKVRPLLSSLSEKKEIEITEEDSHKTLEQYYLPPEVLQGPVGDNSTSHWYDFPGDMYGMGLVIVEMWCQTQDLFQEVRNTPIKEWRGQSNPGEILLNQAKRSGVKFYKDLKSIIKKLLLTDPEKRMTAREFVTEYQDVRRKIEESADDLSICSLSVDKDEGEQTPVRPPRTKKTRSKFGKSLQKPADTVPDGPERPQTSACSRQRELQGPNIPKVPDGPERPQTSACSRQRELQGPNIPKVPDGPERPQTSACSRQRELQGPNIPKDQTLKEIGGQLDYTRLDGKRSSASVKRKEFRKSYSIDDVDMDDDEDDRLPSVPSVEDLSHEEPSNTPPRIQKRSSKNRERYLQAKKKKDPLAELTKTQGRTFNHMFASVPDYAKYKHGVNVVNIMSADSKGRVYDPAEPVFSNEGRMTSLQVSINTRMSKVQLDHAVTYRAMLWRDMSEVKGSGLLADLDSKQQRLQESLFEIISSELAYKKSLKFLVDEFMGKIEQKFTLKPGTIEHTHLFSNIVNVCKVSVNLCDLWERLWCLDVLLDPAEVCETLTHYFGKKENQLTYILYYKNVIYQQRMCSKLNNENEEFTKYCRNLGDSRLSLYDGYLALPFQRIPRYRILVEAIIKSLPGDNVTGPEYQAMQECFDVILKFVAQCNNAVKKMEDLENMITLANRLDFGSLKKVPVISEHRESVKHGYLKHVSADQGYLKKALNGATQPWEIHLFSDLVLMAQSKKNNALLVKCYCKPDQVCAEYITRDNADELLECRVPSSCNFLLKISFFPTGDDTSGIVRDWLVLTCPTSESQLRWIEALSPHMLGKDLDFAKIINYSRSDCPVVQVIHSYRGQHEDELTIYEGEILKILRKLHDSDWCEGEKMSNGDRGWYPGKFAVEIENAEDRKGIVQEQNKVMQVTMRFNETHAGLKGQLHSLKELQALGAQ